MQIPKQNDTLVWELNPRFKMLGFKGSDRYEKWQERENIRKY